MICQTYYVLMCFLLYLKFNWLLTIVLCFVLTMQCNYAVVGPIELGMCLSKVFLVKLYATDELQGF